MKNFKEIQQLITEWSQKNFGDQVHSVSGVTMGSLNPLLGMGEEIGELGLTYISESLGTEQDLEDRKDALADILIYMCDYAGREHVTLQFDLEKSQNETVPQLTKTPVKDMILHLSVAYSELLHATLKRSQGIRGYDDDFTYTSGRDMVLSRMTIILCAIAAEEGVNLLEALNEVAQKVLKRDWVENPENASELAEAE